MSGTPSTQPQAGPRATRRLGTGPDDLAAAAALLAAGRLVAFPTETVYGLGADGRNAAAVVGLYAAKGRPRFNPLIAHVADVAAARREGAFDADAKALAQAFWPGPLTLVVPRAATGTVCDLARAGLGSIGLRMPSHPVARQLLLRTGFPVVAPSANRSGRISPTASHHVLDELDGAIDAVMEGEPADVGVESTIVACLGAGPRLLRPGGLAREAIEGVLGRPLDRDPEEPSTPLAPGALASHYAPRARVRLDVLDVQAGQAALLFGPASMLGLSGAAAVLNLSQAGDLEEAAANLFGHLRRLDETQAPAIAVAPVPERGLGEAINDRLRRAAAER